MTSIDIQLDGDNCWPDLAELGNLGLVESGDLRGIALLPDAEVIDTFTGNTRRVPSVTLRIHVANPAGPKHHPSVVLVQLKVETLDALTRAMKGRLEYLEDLRRRGGAES